MLNINISSFFNRNRLAGTLFELKIKSRKALEEVIDVLEFEKQKKLNPGRNRFLVNNFSSINQGFFLSALIETEFKWHEIAPGTDSTKIIERKAYINQNVPSILNTSQESMFVFATTNKISWNFCNRLRDLTIGRLNPKRIVIHSKGMRSYLKDLDDIIFLKLKSKEDKTLNTISMRGKKLMGNNIINALLSNGNLDYIEIGGVKEIENETLVKIYINSKGRFWIYGNPENVDSIFLFDLLARLEEIQKIN